MANVIKYWPATESEELQQPRLSESVELSFFQQFEQPRKIGVVNIFIPEVRTDESGTRMPEKHEQNTSQEQQPKNINVTDNAVQLAGKSSRNDFELLSVANISGVSRGLVKYKGKYFFVSAGDTISGTYLVKHIGENKIFIESLTGNSSL